jgi:aerobic carbon-monoxide dehydrogenase small subunit
MSSDGAAVDALEVTINGEPHSRTVLARQLLVHFIRDGVGLRGTHIGCDTGNCGACTVICDGKLTKSCMMLAVQADGCEITTVEGLAPATADLTPLQQAFNNEHGVQCGYCTPGMLMSATFLLERNPDPSEHEIRRALKGNICRCTGYENIVRAVQAAASGRSNVTEVSA